MTGKHSFPQDENETPDVDVLAEAMRQMGWLVPDDESTVAEAQEALAREIASITPAPFASVASGEPGAQARPRPPLPLEQARSLARAARRHGPFDAEILKRMDKDRRDAREQIEHDEDPADEAGL